MDCHKISGTAQVCTSTKKHPTYEEHERYHNTLFNRVHKTRFMGETTGSVSELLKKEPRIHHIGIPGHILPVCTWDGKAATACTIGHHRTSQQFLDAAQFWMCQSWFFPPSSLLRTMTLVMLDPQEDITPSIVTLKNHSRKKTSGKKNLQVLLNHFWS